MTSREEAFTCFEMTPRHHRGRDNATRPALLLRSVSENCAFNGVTDNAQLIAQAAVNTLSEEFLPARNNPTPMREMRD
jgi:hypothetical protein